MEKLNNCGSENSESWLNGPKGLLDEAKKIIMKYCTSQHGVVKTSVFDFMKKYHLFLKILVIIVKIKQEIVEANLVIFNVDETMCGMMKTLMIGKVKLAIDIIP